MKTKETVTKVRAGSLRVGDVINPDGRVLRIKRRGQHVSVEVEVVLADVYEHAGETRRYVYSYHRLNSVELTSRGNGG